MRLLAVLFALGFANSAARAQAPASAALWDVPATTLAMPPALEAGATAAFWNPAAALAEGTRLGAQTVQTPDVVGLSGVIAGLTHALGSRLGVGLIFGRVEIGDLVRTSTSPASQEGDIPVYEELGGVALGVHAGPVAMAALVRGHDARFDVFHEAGLTLDLGIRANPVRALTLAGASHFVPVNLSAEAVARYYGGVEYTLPPIPFWGSPALLVGRYGIIGRRAGPPEHTLGAGLGLASRLRVDVAYARERAYDDTAWRLTLAVGIRAGRYEILAARGSGVGGVGANYRVGLDLRFAP